MLLYQITETMSRQVGGGIITDENKFDEQFLISVLNRFRGQHIKNTYANLGIHRINPVCYQKFYPTYSSELNETLEPFAANCPIKFWCPEVISLSNQSDGLQYVGTRTNRAFPRILSRQTASAFNNHHVMKKYAFDNGFIYDGGAQELLIYGGEKKILVEALFANPLDVPQYNPQFDPYPLGEDDISAVLDLIFRAETSIEASTTPDILSNSRDDSGLSFNQRKR